MDEPKHDGNFGLKMARSLLGYYPLFSLGKINSFSIIVETPCITRRRKKGEKTIALLFLKTKSKHGSMHAFAFLNVIQTIF